MQRIQPVILSGGSGTRLWPMSRGLYPKQFMNMEGDTLFGQTVRRVASLADTAPPIVVCNKEHRFLAAAILQQQTATATILLEPVGRNTAPAIALAALAAREHCPGPDDDPVLLVLSSDHVITPQQGFSRAVGTALSGAENGGLVVFGVPPARPETGFGYIKEGSEAVPGVRAVDAFVEKPSRAVAEAMLRDGDHVWNSGMFLFKASVFLKELAVHAPEVHACCEKIWQKRQEESDFTHFPEEDFTSCPAISVDYAVMEHTQKALVTRLDADWTDMGSWEAFYETRPKDTAGNVATGDVIQLDSRDCYLHSSHRLVAAVGLEDISVVETADAVLVMPRERSQDVKLLLETMRRQERPETDTHVKVYRPWGSYERLVLGDRFQVKRLIVNPGGILSLQLHHHRAEHWVVVTGTARVTVGEDVIILKEDQSTYIPLGVRHRLENPGRIPLEIIEIQSGSYLGEDDILRFEDTYGRIKE